MQPRNDQLQIGQLQTGQLQTGQLQVGQTDQLRTTRPRKTLLPEGLLGTGTLVYLVATAVGCSYRLPDLPTADASLDGAAWPSGCPIVSEVNSPSCPPGTEHCERVTVVLPSAPWTVGPNSYDPSATASFEARGGRTIALDVHEVDVARYRRFVAASGFADERQARYPDGSTLSGRGAPAEAENAAMQPLCTYSEAPGADTLPVNCVSWEAALAFCAFDGGRLPTLAELELVRRWWSVEGLDAPGEDGRLYPWGDEEPGARFGTPLPARFAGGASAMGAIDADEGPRIGCLYGIAGGVTEWLADAAPGGLDDPCYADGVCEGPADHRVVATGGWDDLDPEWMRSSAFAGRFSTERIPGQGFRCVYDVE